VFYDTLANVLGTKTTARVRHHVVSRQPSRDTLVTSPIDSVQTVFQTKRVQYDLMGHDTLTVDSGPGVTAPAQGVAPFAVSLPAQTVTVRKHYDFQGNSTRWRAGPIPTRIISVDHDQVALRLCQSEGRRGRSG